MGGVFDIRVLTPLVAAGKQQNHLAPDTCVIDSVSGSIIDAQFPNSATQRFAVAELARCQSTNSRGNTRLCLTVAQIFHPRLKHVAAIPGQIVCNPIHDLIVTYELRSGKRYIEARNI